MPPAIGSIIILEKFLTKYIQTQHGKHGKRKQTRQTANTANATNTAN